MLHFQSFGSSSSPLTLFFLHGFLGSSLDWVDVIKPLESKYHCILLDLPAHGKSPYSDNVLKELENTISSFSLSSCALIGYSMGGRLALSYAQKNPSAIKLSIILSSHLGLSTSIEKKKRLEEDIKWAERLITLSSHDFLKAWYDQSVFSSLHKRPLLLQSILEKRVYNNPKELSSILKQLSLSKQPLHKTFSKPTYFLFGEEDEKYENLYTSLSDSVKRKIPQAGHVVHLENSFAVSQAIQTILQKEEKNEHSANLDSSCKT